MIIRILGEGQYDVPDDGVDSLNELDDLLEKTVDAGDEEAFSAALSDLLDRVRTLGEPVAIDALVTSTLVLPYDSATLAEVRDLLADDGLIPG
jgi:hypothetical protein